MSPPEAAAILADLQVVARERACRTADPSIAARVLAVKSYQQARFRRTYSDLLSSKRYAPAAQFFLNDLYGPADFSERDAQFERVVPALVRLFPQEIVRTVATLARLHAMSESLDSEMARRLDGVTVDRVRYIAAWQQTGRAGEREQQVVLTLEIGSALERYTRNIVLRNSLKLMRGPARAAGLSSLQTFLETGFDTFRAMRGADEFLGIVGSRERALCEALFDSREAPGISATPDTVVAGLLGQLP